MTHATQNPANKAQEVAEFLTSLMDADQNETLDLLVNYGEDMEAKAKSVTDYLQRNDA